MYCTADDLIAQATSADLAELTTESGDQYDQAVVDEAIAKADRRIDARCAGRYKVPFDPVPELIKSLSVDLTLHGLYIRRGLVDEARKLAADEADKLLKEIAAGKSSVPGADGQQLAPSAPASGGVDLGGPARDYTRDSMMDY